MGFPSGSVVKNPPAMQGTWFYSLGQEDPLGKEMAAHSSILAWSIPWTEEPGGLQSMALQELDTSEWLNNSKQQFLEDKGLKKGLFFQFSYRYKIIPK